MSEVKSPENTPPQKPSNTGEAEEAKQRKLNRIAAKMAKQANKTQTRYEKNQDIFTK